MSVADLKSRLADVPGIETLTMAVDAGRINLRWGEYLASVDAAATDHDIEVAVRNANRLPSVALIPDKPASPANGAPTMSTNPASAVSAVETLMQGHMKAMAEIQETQLRILESTLTRQRDTVAGSVGRIAERIASQTDDFEAMMSRFGN